MSSLLEYVALSTYEAFVTLFAPSLGSYYTTIDPEELKINEPLARGRESIRNNGAFQPYNRLLQENNQDKAKLFTEINNKSEDICGFSVRDGKSFSNFGTVEKVQVQFGLTEEKAIALSLVFATVYENISLLNNTIEAIKRQSVPARKKVISLARPKTGLTVLHLALQFNSTPDCLKVLLQSNELESLINNSKNKFTIRPLEVAILRAASMDTFRALLSAKANILAPDSNGNNFLSLYLAQPNIDKLYLANLLRLLSEHVLFGSLLEQKNQSLMTLLNVAAFKEVEVFFVVLDVYKKHCPKVLADEEFLQSLALSSIETQSRPVLETVKILAKTQNIVLHEKLSLNQASAFGNANRVKELIANGQDILAVTTGHISSLYYAVDSGDLETVKVISAALEKKRKQAIEKKLAAANDALLEINFMFLSSAIHAIRQNNVSVAKFLILKVFHLGISCSRLVNFAVSNCHHKELIYLLLTTIDGVENYQIGGENILVVAAKQQNEAFFTQLLESTTFSNGVEENQFVRSFVNSLDLTNVSKQVAHLSTICAICLESPSDTRFMPCGHIQCCKLCAHKVVRSNPRCPSCRSSIETIVSI